jgi:hypothetical protein
MKISCMSTLFNWTIQTENPRKKPKKYVNCFGGHQRDAPYVLYVFSPGGTLSPP